MGRDTFCEAERKRLNKLNKFQLSNRFKKIGIAIVIITFMLMISKRFFDEPSCMKPVLSHIFLLGFLIISISKEKIEDELIVNLRSQSYRLAFITGVIYATIQPYITYAVNLLMHPEKAAIEMSYFQVLIFMLVVQLAFFESLKRYR